MSVERISASVARRDSHEDHHAPGECAPGEAVRRLQGMVKTHRRRWAKQTGWTRRVVPTGLIALDRALGDGGLPCGAVTEILAHAPGVGATSLALRIAAAADRAFGGGLSAKANTRGAVDGAYGCESAVNRISRSRVAHAQHDPSPTRRGGRIGVVDGRHRRNGGGRTGGTGEGGSSAIVFVDTAGDFYPPAALGYGIALDRLIVIRPARQADAFWATDQALRCPAVSVVVASLSLSDSRLSRRLQLAAESSGSIGVILRPANQRGPSFAAIQILVEGVGEGEYGEGLGDVDVSLSRITLLKVREGRPVAPFLLDLCHETGDVLVHSVPVDRPIAKVG